jgi:uncharacterized membrane protein
MTHAPNSRCQRLEAFSDGVIAIAITLLAFELKVPNLISTTIYGEIQELLPYVPGILAFILSFVTIAIFWVNHHQMTEHIEELNRRIVWSNMLFLMFQSLIPFATRAIATSPSHYLSVATYSFILFCGSVSFSLVHYLIHKKINKHLSWNSKLVQRSLLGPIIYACAIIASFNFVPIAYFLLAIPPMFYFLPKRIQA